MIAREHSILSADGIPMLKLFTSKKEPFLRKYNKHHHTAFEISLFEKGNGIYRIGKKEYTLNAGDIFIFGSNEEHCITQNNDGGMMIINNIHFEPRFIWSHGNDLFDFKYLQIFTDRNESFSNKLDINNPAAADIRRLMMEMFEEFTEKEPGYELFIKIKLLNILALMIRKFDYISDTNESFSVKRRNLYCLEQAMIYIDNHISDDLTLEKIAGISGISRTYFSTLFKKLNGLSLWDYITIRRIDKSVEYLKTTDNTILDIACKCGFNNTANFNRAFKKVTGQVPKYYRQEQK